MTQELETVIMTAVETHVEQAVALLTELVNIPSVVPLGSESAGDGERRVQEVLERELRALGAEVDLWEPDVAELAAAYRGKPGFQPNRQFENRPNLVARLPGDGTGRSIMLAGHIDVVAADSADWHSEPFDARIVDGRLVGRGTADMKAGVVASWLALKALKEAGVQLAGDVLFVSVVDEEVGGMGTLAVTHRGYRADAGVMTEPTGLTLCPVVRGIIWGHIDVPGRAGHIEEPFDAANPEAPIDAIDKARIVLGAIDKINASWRNDPRKSHPLIEIPNQVSVSMIHAGDHPSSFAATCRITFDIQYLTSE